MAFIFIFLPFLNIFPAKADPLRNVLKHMLGPTTKETIQNNYKKDKSSKNKYQLILLGPSSRSPIWGELSKREYIKRGETWMKKKSYIDKAYTCRKIKDGDQW